MICCRRLDLGFGFGCGWCGLIVGPIYAATKEPISIADCVSGALPFLFACASGLRAMICDGRGETSC
ncbi:hypothetical protein F4861DRAFT_509817 [Xylaria intraflava]|nr:hypothetical protein F4861DRAFT_509817 [Xylaria intraflava]